MRQHATATTRGFLLALVLGGAAAMLLTPAGVAELWAIVLGWAVFLLAGTLIGRRLHGRHPG